MRMRTAGRDLGLRKAHRFSRLSAWIWAPALVASLGFFAWNLNHNYQKVVRGRVADAVAWKIDGPPCRASDRAAFLGRHRKGPKKFTYENVEFFRRYGHVSCAPIYENGGRSDRFYPVCQFTSPGELMVRTPRGDWYFETGPGQPATVSARHGEARCVLASNYTMATVLNEMRGEKR